MNKKMLSLHLFEQENGGSGTACNSAAKPDAPLQEDTRENTEEKRRAEFEKLIKGEYKDLYEERIKSAINRRFRSHSEEKEDLAAKWISQEAYVQRFYPDFSMMETVLDPKNGRKFMAMLSAGFDAKDAYEALNKNEIIDALMRYTAEKVREKTVNDIRLRGMRPEENGAVSAAARFTKSDPSTWSDEELDRVAERVRRGERIVL